MVIFQGIGCRTTKKNITFSLGNEIPNAALKFFPQKTTYRLKETKKIIFGGTFYPISVVLLDRLFPKKKKEDSPMSELAPTM